jgi:hypothetical protein
VNPININSQQKAPLFRLSFPLDLFMILSSELETANGITNYAVAKAVKFTKTNISLAKFQWITGIILLESTD